MKVVVIKSKQNQQFSASDNQETCSQFKCQQNLNSDHCEVKNIQFSTSSNEENKTPLEDKKISTQNDKDQSNDDKAIVQSGKTNWTMRIGIAVVVVLAILGLSLGLVFGLNNNKQSDKPIFYLSTSADHDYILDPPYQEGEEVVQTYDHVRLNTTEALCLDGSPGSYFVSRTGDESRVLIYFQGGGWCYGDDDYYTRFGCYLRSQMWLGSSNSTFIPDTTAQANNIFSKHPDNEFRNWKKIIFNYCDGLGHQGYRKDPIVFNGSKVYLRGDAITTERFQDLQNKYGLFSKAKRVVVSGGSAGGVAALMWTNYLVDRVQNGKVYSIIDSSLFPDTVNVNTKTNIYKNRMQNLMNLANVEKDLPTTECLVNNPNEKVNCFYVQHFYKYVRAPMYFIQSGYDSWSTRNIIGINCTSMRSCTGEQKQAADEYQKNITTILQDITSSRGNGAFGISCELHGMITTDLFGDPRLTVPSGSEWTVNKAIGQWFRDKRMNNSKTDSQAWPSNEGCKDLIFFH